MAIARFAPASATEPRPISDLNTTPLIDVLLVLLIMLLMTMPPPTHKVGMALPTGAATSALTPDLVRNRITIDARGRIAWNGHDVSRAGLRTLLAASMRMPVEPALDFVPAAEARYEMVDGVIADIRHAGVTRLGLPGNEAYRAF